MSQHRKSSRVICAAACAVLSRLATGATPSYNFTPVGLTGSPYSYANATGNTISTQIYTLNSSGQIVGVSNRYNASSSSLGQDTWYFDGSTTTQVGLTGGAYSYTYTGTGGRNFSIQQSKLRVLSLEQRRAIRRPIISLRQFRHGARARCMDL